MSELEMLGLLWFNVEERIQRFRKIGVLEWIYHIRPTCLQWESPEHILFTSTARNKFVRGALASSKSSVIDFSVD